MEPASQVDLAILFLALPFLFTTGVLCFIGARLKREKIGYLGTIISFLGALFFVSYLLEQAILVFIIFSIIGLLSIWGLPKLHRLMVREQVKVLSEVDLSAPLRVRDFLTVEAWLKMASRWGVWKTFLLCWLFSVTIGSGPFFIASLLGIISMTDFIRSTIIASTFSTIVLYWQFSKVF